MPDKLPGCHANTVTPWVSLAQAENSSVTTKRKKERRKEREPGIEVGVEGRALRRVGTIKLVKRTRSHCTTHTMYSTGRLFSTTLVKIDTEHSSANISAVGEADKIALHNTYHVLNR